jgi:hypothetical protein
MIFLRYSFCKSTRSKSFFTEVEKKDALFIGDVLKGDCKNELSQWEIEFFGFSSPKDQSYDPLIGLHDYGLSGNEIVYNAIGRALYLSLFEGQTFKKAFSELIQNCPKYLFGVKNNGIDHILNMETPIEAYLALKHTANHGCQAIHFFFQYVAYYKSKEKMKLLEKFFRKMPSELEIDPSGWANYGEKFTPCIASRIMLILANAFLREKPADNNDAIFISKLHVDVLKLVVQWMAKLDKSFYRTLITVSNLNGEPDSVLMVLNNLGLSKTK